MKSILRAVTGIDLTSMDQEIKRLEGELGKLKITRQALGQLQITLSDGAADPTIAIQGTILDRVQAFLAGGKEATAVEIAAAIGEQRSSVYQAIKKHQEQFRSREDRWRLK